MDKIREELNLPATYDHYGQRIIDSKGNLLVYIRGWGMFQKKENGQEIQDGLGVAITDFINGQSSLKAENDRLKAVLKNVEKDFIEDSWSEINTDALCILRHHMEKLKQKDIK